MPETIAGDISKQKGQGARYSQGLFKKQNTPKPVCIQSWHVEECECWADINWMTGMNMHNYC